ncbi:unnamed protein product, partial [Allacma fusca]
KNSALKAAFFGLRCSSVVRLDPPPACSTPNASRCKENSWIRYPSIFFKTFHGDTANISSITMDHD